MGEALWRMTLRIFFKVVAVFFGIGVGMLILAAVFKGSADMPNELKLDKYYVPDVLPNALGERKLLANTAPVIWQLNIVGTIGTEVFNEQTVRQQLAESREGILKDGRVKALLLYINSPGGTVTDSDAIYRAVKQYKERYKVPVYAYVDGMCASGGLYIACAADKIYASDTSLVGSVGVLASPFFNFHELINKIGVQALTVYAGKGKDDLNSWRPWRAGEQDHLQQIIEAYYQRFVTIVTQARPTLSREKLINDIGAMVFLADEAHKHGLIDHSGASMSAVLQELAKEVGATEQEYQVIQLEKKNWVKELFRDNWSSAREHIVHQIDWGDGLSSRLRGQLLYLYQHER